MHTLCSAPIANEMLTRSLIAVLRTEVVLFVVVESAKNAIVDLQRLNVLKKHPVSWSSNEMAQEYLLTTKKF